MWPDRVPSECNTDSSRFVVVCWQLWKRKDNLSTFITPVFRPLIERSTSSFRSKITIQQLGKGFNVPYKKLTSYIFILTNAIYIFYDLSQDSRNTYSSLALAERCCWRQSFFRWRTCRRVSRSSTSRWRHLSSVSSSCCISNKTGQFKIKQKRTTTNVKEDTSHYNKAPHTVQTPYISWQNYVYSWWQHFLQQEPSLIKLHLLIYIMTYLRHGATLLHVLHFSLCSLQSRVVLVNSRLDDALSFPYRLLPFLETCHSLLEFRCSLNNQYVLLNIAKAHANRKRFYSKISFMYAA